MKDLQGHEVNVGDRVAYVSSGAGKIQVGTVKEITTRTWHISGQKFPVLILRGDGNTRDGKLEGWDLQNRVLRLESAQ